MQSFSRSGYDDKDSLNIIKNRCYLVVLSNKFSMRVVLIFLVFLCLSHMVQAQHSVVKGYVVTVNKDTLSGFIQDKMDKELILEVNFFSDKSQPSKTYSPSQIIEFGMGNRIFRRFSVNDSDYQFGKLVNEGTLYFLVSSQNKEPIYFVNNNLTGNSATLVQPVKMQGQHYSAKRISSEYLYANKFLSVAQLPTELSVIKQIPFREKAFRKFVTDYNVKSNIETAKVYTDSIIQHHIISVGVFKSTTGDYPNPGYTVSYFFGKENRDLNRKGFWIHGVRYESVSETRNFSVTNTSYLSKISAFQLLPFGYRYAPMPTKSKPYLIGVFGLGFYNEKGYSGYPTLAPNNVISVVPVFNFGGGFSINTGKGNLVLESSFDIPLNGLYGYRLGIGYDF